jgi:glucose/mannose-6-phosphate isomerase
MVDLDSSTTLKAHDHYDMMSQVLTFPNDITGALKLALKVKIPLDYSSVKRIVYVGMGGSGIPGDFLKILLTDKLRVPLAVIKDYTLPPYVDSDTLVLAVSYSGTTEETIYAYKQARQLDAKIFGVTSGAQLLALLQDDNIAHVVVPSGRTTRASFGWLLFTLLGMLQRIGLTPDMSLEINETKKKLTDQISIYGPEVSASRNSAKTTALALLNKIPVICGTRDNTDVIALRWRQQLNENCKVFAQNEYLPEANHNSLEALATTVVRGFSPVTVFLRDLVGESYKMRDRIEATKEFLQKQGIEVLEFVSNSPFLLTRLLTLSYIGDFVSLYLAAALGVDPTSLEMISKFKEMLKKNRDSQHTSSPSRF